MTHAVDTGLVFEVGTAATNKPVFEIKNTHNGGTGGKLRFNNTEGGAGSDNDVLGSIEFYGTDDGSNSQ